MLKRKINNCFRFKSDLDSSFFLGGQIRIRLFSTRIRYPGAQGLNHRLICPSKFVNEDLSRHVYLDTGCPLYDVQLLYCVSHEFDSI